MCIFIACIVRCCTHCCCVIWSACISSRLYISEDFYFFMEKKLIENKSLKWTQCPQWSASFLSTDTCWVCVFMVVVAIRLCWCSTYGRYACIVVREVHEDVINSECWPIRDRFLCNVPEHTCVCVSLPFFIPMNGLGQGQHTDFAHSSAVFHLDFGSVIRRVLVRNSSTCSSPRGKKS